MKMAGEIKGCNECISGLLFVGLEHTGPSPALGLMSDAGEVSGT